MALVIRIMRGTYSRPSSAHSAMEMSLSWLYQVGIDTYTTPLSSAATRVLFPKEPLPSEYGPPDHFPGYYPLPQLPLTPPSQATLGLPDQPARRAPPPPPSIYGTKRRRAGGYCCAALLACHPSPINQTGFGCRRPPPRRRQPAKVPAGWGYRTRQHQKVP